MKRALGWMAVCAMIVALAGIALTGCGGGDEATTSTTVTPTTLAPAAGDGEAATTGAAVLVGTALAVTENTPADVKSALDQKQPLVLMFYAPGGSDDTKVLQSLTALTPKFPTAFIAQYDYKAPDAYGDLGQLLQIGYLPEVVLIDSSATVTQVFSGYVDEGSLNQSLVNLTR